ncbi:MAG: ABC transporter substrate-binding protein [Eubacteriales bacterium]|nr:ABC transporter substrate-binding protein [Eubacteriales bacterium]
MRKRIGKTLKRMVVAMAAVITMSSLAACGGADSSSSELDTEAVVTFAVASPWDTMNIYASNGGSFTGLICDKIYDRLVYVNESFEVEPRAAESWEIDGKTVTFHLNKDCTWHDGAPVTAKDWVFTAQFASSSEVTLVSRGFSQYVEGTNAAGIETSANSIAIEAKDDYTLVVHLKDTYAMDSFLVTSARQLYVLPEHILGSMSDSEIMTNAYWDAPIGSGPCIYESQIAGSEVTLKTFDKYQLGQPKFSKLVFKVTAQSNFANAIMSGDADLTYTHMTVEDALALEGQEGVTIRKQDNPTFMQVWVFDNTTVSKNMRNALNAAIDKQLIIDQFYYGAGELTDTIILPGSEYYYDNPNKGQNIEKAKEYLAEAIAAGEWSADKVFEIGVNTDSRQKQGELIQQELEAVGIKSKVVMYDSTTMWSKINSHTLTSCMMGLMPSNDPLSMAKLYDPTTTRFFSTTNTGWTTIIKSIEAEQDKTKRKELVKQLQEMEYDEMPASWICAQYSYAATSARIKNVDSFASDMINNAVWKWEVVK